MHDIVRPSASAPNLNIGSSNTGAIIRQARLTFDGAAVFDGLDFALEAGLWTCLLGPSGVGKTTLLRLIAGLLPGALVSADGGPLDGRVALMAQQDLLLPWLGALDNVLLGYRLRAVPRAELTRLREGGRELLDRVGLGG